MIYLLEDDDSIRKLVIYGLQSQGYEARGFALPSQFWRAMDEQLPELVEEMGWDTVNRLLSLQEADMGSKGVPGEEDQAQFRLLRKRLEELRA